MKSKSITIVLLVSLVFVSCVPAAIVVPTATAIPTFTATITVTPLPTATSTPDHTPTPTPVPSAWTDSVREVAGKTDPVLIGNKLGNQWIIEGNGWVIDTVEFDPATVGGFTPDDGMKLDDPRNANDPPIDPRFGSEAAGQVHLRCYAEITLPNGSKVNTGFVWFQQTFQPLLSEGIPTWHGINYSLGLGSYESAESMGGTSACQTKFTQSLEEGNFDTSFALVLIEQIATEQPNRDELLASLFLPLFSELAPPDEFWRTGDVSLLPKVGGKPFLLATHFGFKQSK